MPHSSRKKVVKPTYQKRVQLDDADGWTHMTTSRRSQHHGTDKPHGTVQHRDKFVPAEVPVGFRLGFLEKEYARYNDIWTGSECWKRLRDIFLSPSGKPFEGDEHDDQQKQTKQGEGNSQDAELIANNLAELSLNSEAERPVQPSDRITSCVCLGLGSLVDPVSRKTSLYQLVALQSILEILRTRYAITKVYAQDPVFNHMDIEFLKNSCNITVLPDPEAFAKIDSSTFLYAPHCERTFLLPGLKGKKPALSISNTMETLVNGPISTSLADEEIDIAKAFLEGQSATRFPDFEPQPGTFNDMSVYLQTEAD
ncbi:hypothetical protein L228DRAFT_266951 [Xylona heveae TC161]|uniref:SRR1-like domain-containing protein n=1 Tax=Xylona heveae (strain CBS 132557 / TC161) TaxID=1328760 RepID=A0A165IAN1_XYLHT|nr:hypothetical protein L228DRAFT_266951 [Xylona heveae TC161]KZF24631.1 hypothetical protein L228DRAFT_266951 [Xylona heveae TC161]